MSHIKTIEIKNFKSIRHQKIEDCRRVNVFIGYPNVGKSNILEALGLFGVLNLRFQSFKLSEICRVKHFSELYFNRNINESTRVIINEEIETVLTVDEAKRLQINGNKLPYSKTDSSSIFSLSISDEDIEANPMKGDSISFNLLVTRHGYSYDFDGVKKYEFNNSVNLKGNKPRSLSVPYGDNLLDVLMGNSELRREIVDIFKQYELKLNLDTTDETIKFIKELKDGSIITIPYYQVADTLRRLIFYKAAIQTNSNSVLLFEEPEAHMFPPYIAKFTTDIIFDEQDNQYFITTHSPFVINDFMEELEDDQLSIYAVGYKREEGETVITRLTDEQLTEIYQYGVDLFFNLEDYLKDAVS